MSLLPPSKQKLAIENIVAPRTAPEYAGIVGLSVLIGLFSAGNIFGIVGLVVVGFIWWWSDRQRAKERLHKLYEIINTPGGWKKNVLRGLKV